MKGKRRQILQRKNGQALTEYALILALVAAAIAAAVGGFGASLDGVYRNIGALVGAL
jgi:Flp pilus assembly pilin Flp